MKSDIELLQDTAEELFEDAPCGYVSTRLDGTIIKVNRTFETWTGRSRTQLLEQIRFQELLAPGDRIYHETHFAPLLRMQGFVREIAVDIVRADGSRLPALINSVVRVDAAGRPRVIRTTIFDATDRRRYERELLRARKREHEVASELQRSLLTGELPDSPAAHLAVFYEAAVTGMMVGGDWYDAFWLDEQRTLALVIGDVVGRGIAAAAAMGQLRSAVRALCFTAAGPADLVSALDSYSSRHGVGAMTTMIYAELDVEQRRLRFACAGHPPPLIAAPGREPEFAWEGRSAPLNPYGFDNPRHEACLDLEPGTTIWLYTDGLVEDRNQSSDEGLSRLRGAVADQQAETVASAVNAVADLLHRQAQADDVCVIAAQLSRAD